MSKRALLVGVTRYVWSAAYAQPLDLRGGANDAQGLAEVLTDSFGFAPADLRILLSEPDTPPEQQATATNIRAGLAWLIAQTSPGDVAVVYYSGHGSQWPDTNGDEIDGYDEAIVPADSRDPADPAPPQGDLLDDELHTYVSQLAARTNQLTVIFDCCHAAGGTRGEQPVGVTTRQAGYAIPLAGGALAPAATTALQTAQQQTAAPAPGARNALDDANPNFVFLAACDAGESAYEAVVGAEDLLWPEEQGYAGQTRGLFTLFLLRALRHGPTATYQDILTFLHDQVQLRQTAQHPQGEGPLARTLFGGSTRPVDWLPVARLDAASLTLDAGSARGLAAGAVVQVYPDPGAVPGVPLGQERPIGTATLTHVYPLTAGGTFDAPPAAQPARARALVLRPVFPIGPLRVAVQAAPGDPLGTALARAIAALPILQLVDPDAAAPDAAAPDAVVASSPTAITFSIRVPAADGHPLPALAPIAVDSGPGIVDSSAPAAADNQAAAAALDTQHSALSTRYSVLGTRYSALAAEAAARLAMLAAFRAGLARSNPGAALAGSVRMEVRLPGAAAPPAGEPHFAAFAKFNLVFHYPAPAPSAGTDPGAPPPPLYLTLLHFAADGAIGQLYPPPGSAERLLPGQQWPPPGYEDYFQVTATPPAGAPRFPVRDRLMLFVATAPLDLRGLLQPAIPTTPTRSLPEARGTALPDLPDARTGDWAGQTLSYLIVGPAEP